MLALRTVTYCTENEETPRGAQLATDRFAFDRLLVRMPRRARRLQVTLDGEELALDAPLVFQAAPRPLRLLVRGD